MCLWQAESRHTHKDKTADKKCSNYGVLLLLEKAIIFQLKHRHTDISAHECDFTQTENES